LKKENKKRKKELEKELEGFSSFEESASDDEGINPHGFVNADMIGAFRKTKSE
jgi:hypothetical protein